MKVKIQLLTPNAVVPFKTYDKDFCYDVTATSEEEVAPNVWKYGLGIAFQMCKEDGFMNSDDIKIGIDLRPRSSIWKTGMVLSNSIGTIDELYNGEVSAVFYHVMPDIPRYKVGDRIGQIKFGITESIEFTQVSKLGETERQNGSYGSTGK